MKRVIGIGGVFFKSANAERLRAWYKLHLGIDVQPWGGAAFHWQSQAQLAKAGATAWSVFPASSDHFAPSTAAFMVNYVVENLSALLAALRAEGCDVDPKTDESEFGKFGWVMDPDGNRVELWEPPPR